MINVDELHKRMAVLRAVREKLLAELNAANGAISELQRVIDMDVPPEEPPAEEAALAA